MFISKALVFLAAAIISSADGHGYLQTPRSRNFVASQEGKSWDAGPTDPAPEYCPHCLNVVGPQCGQVGSTNYDYPPSGAGGILPPKIQATYNKGAIIDVDVKVTAHHKGHFEFRACAINPGEVATESCFKAHPLEFVEDKIYGATKDPNYPYRAYMAPSTLSAPLNHQFSYRMKLPNDVVGDLVLIQWWWGTANSCDYEGYEQYNWPASWGEMDSPVGKCSPPTYSSAEQFWNCAEVRILSDGSPLPVATRSPTVPIPSTVAPTTVAPVPAVTIAPALVTVAPVPSLTEAPSTKKGPTTSPATMPIFYPSDGTCPCRPGYCCSQWGYCGTGVDYCGAETIAPALMTSAPVPSPTKAPSTKTPTTRAPTIPLATTPRPTTKSPTTKRPTTKRPTTKSPTTKSPTTKSPTTSAPTTSPATTPVFYPSDGTCPCRPGYCCSQWGYCGTSAAYCGRRELVGGENE